MALAGRSCSIGHKTATTNGPSGTCFYCGESVWAGQGWISWPTENGRVIAHLEKRDA